MTEGLSLFDLMRLARAEELRRARCDPNDPDAAILEAVNAQKAAIRARDPEDPEGWT